MPALVSLSCSPTQIVIVCVGKTYTITSNQIQNALDNFDSKSPEGQQKLRDAFYTFLDERFGINDVELDCNNDGTINGVTIR